MSEKQPPLKQCSQKPAPKYIQLYNKLRSNITSGRWSPGELLPSEREIMSQYSVSHATVTNAMRLLVQEGLISRKRRAGTVVTGADERRAITKSLVFILTRGPHEETKNPHAWFINDGILRGAIAQNQHHVIRYVQAADLKEVLRNETRPVSYIWRSELEPEQLEVVQKSLNIQISLLSSAVEVTNSVIFDRLTSSYNGVNFLIQKLGHRDIALIWGGKLSHQDNLAAYRLALEQSGIPVQEELIVNSGGGMEQEGYQAAKALLERSQKFTALFVDTDLKAIGAIRCLREHGIRVPQDVSVLGSDDILGVSDRAGLTTIHKDFERMGAEALRMLDMRLRSGGADIASVIVQGTIVERETCMKNLS